ncbi:S-layer homology domain-containing protein [Paenibacillus daejeonensis]|uniref:S-layer homology domain-containing protein n=1 Tax=Paenibacillus daejeonensis TaxID=135193 RepID=UPI00037549E0|nr:S-layer homology domain-containing protein [Paenibacillus daejeonensis]
MGCAMLLLLPALVPAGAVQAAAVPVVTLEAAEGSDKIEVVVRVLGARDLYAWDIVIHYDAERLRWLDAKTGLPGYAVQPIHQPGQVRYAHTRTGQGSGRDGDFELARLSFQRIAEGAAMVGIENAKLVDSKLAMEEVQPKQPVVIESGVSPGGFSDLDGHWSREAVLEGVARGIVSGFEDGTFRPDLQVTREAFAVLLVRALGDGSSEGMTAGDLLSGQSDDGQPAGHTTGVTGTVFTDEKSIASWAIQAVQAAVTQQWIIGYEDGSFRPKQPITRQELAAIIARTMDRSAPADPSVLSRFADRHQLGEWAIEPMALAVEAGLLQGRGPRLLGPLERTTRAEAVTLILRIVSN